MEVLIVSKTHMKTAVCVGGLVLNTNENIRLLNPGGRNQPSDTKFNVGDVWDIEFAARTQIDYPHVEDVIIRASTYRRNRKYIATLIRQRNLIDWDGSIDSIFDGHLSWTTSGSGYADPNCEGLACSVGFWVSDQDLVKRDFYGVRYRYPMNNANRSVKFVGNQEPLDTIPAGTILRVSLSRSFETNGVNGCWLQLSGWY
jgi:hypothetical protein